jgi:hypothetical protein
MSRFLMWFSTVLVSALVQLGAAVALAQSPTIAIPGVASNGKLDIFVPSTGLPLVVFQDASTIKAMQCANALCTGAPTSVATVASLSSIARIRVTGAADGLPLISISVSFNGLRAIKCSNASCTLSTTTVVDPGNHGNGDHAVVVPADGRPIFAIFDGSNSDLKVARCANAQCTGTASVVVADGAGTAGRAPAIAIIAGLPQIAYNLNFASLRLLRCGNLDCTVGNSFSMLAAESPIAASMIEGRSGSALIAYQADASPADSLRLLRCLDTSCVGSSVSTIDTHSSGPGLGAGVQMRSGADGLPVISYFDNTLGAIKLARCTRADCAATTVTTVHAPALAPLTLAAGTGLAINGNAVPMIAYALSGVAPNLIVNSCNTRSCL